MVTSLGIKQTTDDTNRTSENDVQVQSHSTLTNYDTVLFFYLTSKNCPRAPKTKTNIPESRDAFATALSGGRRKDSKKKHAETIQTMLAMT